jgi:hypothetical protein
MQARISTPFHLSERFQPIKVCKIKSSLKELDPIPDPILDSD